MSETTTTRWDGFSDSDLEHAREVFSFSSVPGGELTTSLFFEIRRRALATARSEKTLSMEDVEHWIKRQRATPAYRLLYEDLRRRPNLDPEHDRAGGL